MAEKDNKKDVSEEEEEPKFLGMVKELIPCKMLFFVMDAGFSSLFSFLSLFYVTSGLTVTQIGLINGIGSGFSLLANPLWGGMVDSAVKHRTFLFVSLSLATTFLEFGKPWLMIWLTKTETVVKCMHNTTLTNTSISHAGKNCTTSVILLNQETLFYAAAINCIMSSIAMSGLTSYLEGAVIKTVLTRKRKHSYGEQKVFGPIGYAVGSFAAGVAVDHYNPHGLSHYLAAFYIYLPLSLMMIPLLYKLTKQAKWDYDTKKEGEKKTLMKHVITSFRRRTNLVFLVCAYISGLTSCMFGSYLFLFMYDTMNPSKTVLSLMTVVASVSELFVYPLSSKLIDLCGGHIRCIIIGLGLYCFRLVATSFCTSPWFVLPLQLFAGASSLSWTAMIEKTWDIFPKEITTTAIGILCSIHWTSASITANVLGGYLYHTYGGANLYRGMACITGAWFLFMIVYFEIGGRAPKSADKEFSLEKGIHNPIEVELEEGKVV